MAMTVKISLVYRLECDWPGCRAVLTIHGVETLRAAVDRARRDDWTVSRQTNRPASKRGPIRPTRCPDHAFRTITNRWANHRRAQEVSA